MRAGMVWYNSTKCLCVCVFLRVPEPRDNVLMADPLVGGHVWSLLVDMF